MSVNSHSNRFLGFDGRSNPKTMGHVWLLCYKEPEVLSLLLSHHHPRHHHHLLVGSAARIMVLKKKQGLCPLDEFKSCCNLSIAAFGTRAVPRKSSQNSKLSLTVALAVFVGGGTFGLNNSNGDNSKELDDHRGQTAAPRRTKNDHSMVAISWD